MTNVADGQTFMILETFIFVFVNVSSKKDFINGVSNKIYLRY